MFAGKNVIGTTAPLRNHINPERSILIPEYFVSQNELMPKKKVNTNRRTNARTAVMVNKMKLTGLVMCRLKKTTAAIVTGNIWPRTAMPLSPIFAYNLCIKKLRGLVKKIDSLPSSTLRASSASTFVEVIAATIKVKA